MSGEVIPSRQLLSKISAAFPIERGKYNKKSPLAEQQHHHHDRDHRRRDPEHCADDVPVNGFFAIGATQGPASDEPNQEANPAEAEYEVGALFAAEKEDSVVLLQLNTRRSLDETEKKKVQIIFKRLCGKLVTLGR